MSTLIHPPELVKFSGTTVEPWPFYDKYARSYRDWLYPEAIQRFQQAEKEFLISNVAPGSSVIDIGCGPGEHLASILDKHCQITAVDFVEEMIEIAKRRIGNGVQFVCDDIMQLSYARDCFDYGICYCTLPNQLDYDRFFNHISSFCKHLIVSIYDWAARDQVVEFYKINGLHPKLCYDERTVFLDEGLRYVFIPEDQVGEMFARNRFDLSIARETFGNIYFGVRAGT